MVPRPRVSLYACIACLLIAVLTGSAAAQQDDSVTTTVILPGTEVTGVISAGALFDVWEFEGRAGEEYRVEMTGSDGLAPLVGLRSTSGDIVVASNVLADGSTAESEPNGSALLLFEIPSDGSYALIATRAGASTGRTTGSYILRFDLMRQPEPTPDTQADVTFRCGDDVLPAALALIVGDQGEQGDGLTVTVFGLDGFVPVVRLDRGDGQSPCVDESAALTSDEWFVASLPDGTEVTFDDSNNEASVLLRHEHGDTPVPVTITIGGRGTLSGALVVVVEGLTIEREGDVDAVVVQPGPRARGSDMILWMLRAGFSRLDPLIEVAEGAACADVGLRTCDESLRGVSVARRNGAETVWQTDRLDSVGRLTLSELAGVETRLSSGNPRTTGGYTLVLYVSLPAER
ncbi:MAG: hypothetical protein IPM16_05355 [Chloroflexi bacterium]|nr:hypothetical protein [Chloroflexota bacterium]